MKVSVNGGREVMGVGKGDAGHVAFADTQMTAFDLKKNRKTFTPGGTRIILCKILWYLEVLGLINI